MSDYIPLALRYRPTRFDQILGQDVLVRTLTNAIETNRVHHAFLFFGPTGCGKTSGGRVLAASLNCKNGPTTKPCGTCENCVSIIAGTSTDVIELDAASNTGIEDIRELKEDARYSPVNSRYKIFIIDEVQGLSGKAEEAMLKLLEEPPANVKVILLTTDKHKLKHTVIARCQDYRFHMLPWNLIAAHLKEVCQTENVTADVEALRLIAKHAQGHMRDALQHLERVMLYAKDEPITTDMASLALGVVDDQLYFDLVECVTNRKFADGVRAIQKILTSGKNVDATLASLLEHLHTLLLIRLCDNTAGLLILSEEEKKKYLHQSQLTKPELLDDMIGYVVNIHEGLYYNVNPQVLLEQFLLKSIKSHFRLSAKSD